MIHEAYLYRRNKLLPLESVQVDIPDGTDTEKAFRIAAHKVMREFHIELVPHSPENEISELAAIFEDEQ